MKNENTYYVTDGSDSLEVLKNGVEIESNGETGDNHQSIVITCDLDSNDWIILTTNGDDLVIGWIDDDGNIEVSEEVTLEWFESFDSLRGNVKEWLRGLVDATRTND